MSIKNQNFMIDFRQFCIIMVLLPILLVGITVKNTLALGGNNASADSDTSIKADLRVWLPDSFFHTQAFKKAHTDFNTLYPNIKLTVDTFENPVTGKTKFLTAVKAGNQPDVGLMNLWWVKDFALNNWIVPIDAFISQDDREDYFPHYIDYATYNGKLYGLFENTDCAVIVYRKDMLQSAGIAEPESGNPWTWEELIQAAQKLTRDQMWGFGVNAKNEGPTTYNQLPFFWMLGGIILDEDGKPAFCSAAARESFQLYYDLIFKYKVTPPESISYGQSDIVRGFAAGRYAIASVNNMQANKLGQTSGLEGKVGVAVYPVPKRGVASRTIHGGWIFTILKTGEEKEKAAWKYIEYMTSPKVVTALGREKNNLPVRLSVYRDDPFFSNADMNIYSQALQGALAKPGDAIYSIVQEAYAAALVKVLMRQSTSQAALDDADLYVKQKARAQGLWRWGD